MTRFIAGLAIGGFVGVALVTYYWWRSDQRQAESLEGWEWQRRSDAEQAGRVESEFVSQTA
ncbi:MAG: hypothetical protein EPO26_03550 [Chloroflexota bacterium]|nr:MAG: hypothetical protein EPO26_03550 [Chloroflexota bacterium]